MLLIPTKNSSGGGLSSIGLSMPSIFSLGGSSPVTTSGGSFAVALVAQARNTVLAGPITGANAAPTMREINNADLPVPMTLAVAAHNPVLTLSGDVMITGDTNCSGMLSISGVLVASSLNAIASISASGQLNAAGDNSLSGGTPHSPLWVSGAWYSGGTGSQTVPQAIVQPTGTSSSTWSTAGTGFGINAPAGFTGNLVDLKINGTSAFTISAAGLASGTFKGSLTGNVTGNVTGTAAGLSAKLSTAFGGTGADLSATGGNDGGTELPQKVQFLKQGTAGGVVTVDFINPFDVPLFQSYSGGGAPGAVMGIGGPPPAPYETNVLFADHRWDVPVLSDLKPPTADVSWGGHKITNLASFAGMTGAPAIAGSVGDLYFRRDTPGTANQRIYVCTTAGIAGAAVWIGIL